MKKELKIFLIILIGWLLLLDFAILKTVITKYILNYNSIIVKNLISGAVVYYPLNSGSLISVLIVPLFIFNALVIVFLSLSYYFWMKSRKNLIGKKIYGKRAQGALEFTMTYGWAIMAFIVSISALLYFGVLNSPTGQAVCALSPGFNCKDFVIGKDGVTLVIENNLGVKILDVGVNITNSDQGPCRESVPLKDIDNGKSDIFFSPCNNIKNIGDKFMGDIVIRYRKEGSSLQNTASGVVSTDVTNTLYEDNEAPVISIMDPTDGKSYGTWFFDLIYNVADYSLNTCWYKLNSNDVVYINNCQNVMNINTNGDGQHTVILYANDSKNNLASKSVTFTTSQTAGVDITKPGWSNPVTTPLEDNLHENYFVLYNTTWTDNVKLAGYVFSIKQGSDDYKNSSYIPFSGTTNISIMVNEIKVPSGSIVYWFFFANDTSGNSESSAIRQFTVLPYDGGSGYDGVYEVGLLLR